MAVKVSSVGNEIVINPVQNNSETFNKIRFELGFDFIEFKENYNFFSFSHLDFFINQPFYISVFRNNNVEFDKSFIKFIENLSKNKFSNEERNISLTKFNNDIQSVFKRKLKDFQINNVLKLIKRNSGATFSVPGAGKTTEILSTYSFFKANNKNLKLLVICPKNAVSAWDEEIEKCFHNYNDFNKNINNLSGDNFQGKMCFISGGIENAQFILNQNPDLSIITFQSNSIYEKHVAEFLQNNQVFCAIDESHRIKSFPSKLKGKYSKSVLNLSALCSYKFIMSGTPMPQEMNDLKSQCGFLFPESIHQQNHYQNIQSIYVRTTKDDIGLEPFKPIYHDIKMSNEHRELYNKIKDVKVREFQSLSDQTTLKKMKKCVMYLLQISSNPRIILDNDFLNTVKNLGLEKLITTSSNKFDAVCNLTNDLVLKGEKVLIWTNFTKNIDLLKLELAHHNPAVIDGRVDAGEIEEIGSRKHNINRFKTDKNCNVFIANPAAASEGISLHIDNNGNKLCSNALYLDRNYNSSQFLQSVDRIHRIGSKATPNIHIFRTIDSIDMKVQERLDMKVFQMMKLLNDKSLKPYIENDIFYPDMDDDSFGNQEKEFYLSYFNE